MIKIKRLKLKFKMGLKLNLNLFDSKHHLNSSIQNSNLTHGVLGFWGNTGLEVRIYSQSQVLKILLI